MRRIPALLALLALGTSFAGFVVSSAMGGETQPTGLPRPDHVVVAVFENHAYEQILGKPKPPGPIPPRPEAPNQTPDQPQSPAAPQTPDPTPDKPPAPYLAELAANGAVLTNSYGITHPSQPNYLAMFSGSTQGIVDSTCYTAGFSSEANLASELIAADKTWASYNEGLPRQGDNETCESGRYARKHNPWFAFNNVPTDTAYTFDKFPTNDDGYAKLPDVSFVVPDLCNDMHDCSVSKGDTWLKEKLGGYAKWAKEHNSLLIITFDEDNGLAGNRIATILYGEPVQPGSESNVKYNHYNLLRTIEDMYGTQHAGQAANSTAITGIWKTSTAPSTGSSGVPELPSTGPSGDLPELLSTWQHEPLKEGVDVYQGLFDDNPGADRWTVTVRGRFGDVLNANEATSLAQRLAKAGFTHRSERVEWPRGGNRTGLLGVRVRVGTFDAKAEADAERGRLMKAGFSAVSEWTGADGTLGAGRTEVQAAVIDPRRFKGSLKASYGVAVEGREKVTEMAAGQPGGPNPAGALLGMNAGFFSMTTGVPTAVSAYDGRLQSAAAGTSAAAILRGDGMDIEFKNLSTKLLIRSGSQTQTVDGVNRFSGPHDIVRFTHEHGAPVPSGPGVEAVLDESGRVLEIRPRGGKAPPGGSVLAGVGKGETWLRAHAKPNTTLTVEHKITDDRGRPVELAADDDVVNGSTLLVQDGKTAVTYRGDTDAETQGAYQYGLKSHPRTLLGVDESGRILMVTANGLKPGESDGLGLAEAAELMLALGAQQAINLDGGGSTTMAVNGKMITDPSDAAGERPVGDALLLTASPDNTPPATPEPPTADNPPPPADTGSPPPGSNPCTGPSWNSDTPYTSGQTVTHHGRNWQAIWWIRPGKEPGATGVWQDLGTC